MYDAHMRHIDPTGNAPAYIGPPSPHPPWLVVSKVPGGWMLFLRYAELDRDPTYGKDWNGWCGYHFPQEGVDLMDLVGLGNNSLKPLGRGKHHTEDASQADDHTQRIAR